MAIKILRPKGDSITDYKLDPNKYYSVRVGNDLRKLKSWINWAIKEYGDSEKDFVIVDRMYLLKSNDYWKLRYRGGYEERYIVYSKIKNG